jgi:hypothetical protein
MQVTGITVSHAGSAVLVVDRGDSVQITVDNKEPVSMAKSAAAALLAALRITLTGVSNATVD